jgi:hypothetical protein
MRILRFVLVNSKNGLGTGPATKWNHELHWRGEATRLHLETAPNELALKEGSAYIAAS